MITAAYPLLTGMLFHDLSGEKVDKFAFEMMCIAIMGTEQQTFQIIYS